MKKNKTEIKIVPKKLQKIVIFDENNEPIIAEDCKTVVAFLCDETGVKLSVSGLYDIGIVELLANNSHKLFDSIIKQYRNNIKNIKSLQKK